MYSFEAQYITAVFGTVNLSNLGNSAWPGNDNSAPILLDANQTLTFFLTGVPVVTGADVTFTGFSNGQQPFAPRATASDDRKGPVLDLGGGGDGRKYELGSNNFPRMIDAFGTPFAYYCAYNGQANKYFGYNADPNNAAQAGYPATLKPYARNGQYENDSGYQIISAGKDKKFGLSGNWDAVDADGRDDQANFSPRLLGGGRQ